MTASNLFFGLLAAVATTAAAAPAFAQDNRSVEVRYADLNLATDGGAKTLKDRVARAARNVCATHGDKSMRAAIEARDCTRQALAKAMPQVELALANGGNQLAENSGVSVSAVR